MKKFVKISLISIFLLTTFAFCLCASFLTINYLKFQSLPLNAEALASANLSIDIFDRENKPINEETLFESCKIEELQPHTKNAFISIEDKEFYNHNGINKKRMIGAMINNIKAGKLKEGASTISQQLIKNTHLSGEKTLERKLKEVALTKKLEKAFSKDEILESYLNIIFFGNNCYGIENASHYYFNKDAKDLNLNESCTLAGLIKSPTRYSPITNYDNCLKRRNLVLSEMQKDGYISIEEKLEIEKQPINLDINSHSEKLNTYAEAALDEAAKILNIPAKQLAVGGYKLHTYLDEEKQADLKESLFKIDVENADNAGIVIDNQTGGVLAYHGKSNFKLMDIKRQPASCIKPILVYAPALNECAISPDTQILDEKVTIGGYSPNNVNKKYSGYVSVTDAVKNSINIPAIKVLSYIGIDTGKAYAEKMGINFDETDDSYAIALGGMSYGTNLKDLATAYTTFAKGGQFAPSTFIQYIVDGNNKLVYVHKPQNKMVLREDAAYLMTNILEETAKSGTARKLADIKNTEIASKTGTVGKKNSNGNTDAYNISYTPQETIGVWLGNLKNTPLSIAGGNQPTEAVRSYVQKQSYDSITFSVPSSVTNVDIDTLELEENHRLVLANPYAPDRYKKSALFSRFNLPQDISTNFTESPTVDASAVVENNQIVVNLNPHRHLKYEIFKDDVKTQTITEKSQPLTLRFAFKEKECDLKIVASYLINSNQSATKTFQLKRQQQKPKEKWYI